MPRSHAGPSPSGPGPAHPPKDDAQNVEASFSAHIAEQVGDEEIWGGLGGQYCMRAALPTEPEAAQLAELNPNMVANARQLSLINR